MTLTSDDNERTVTTKKRFQFIIAFLYKQFLSSADSPPSMAQELSVKSMTLKDKNDERNGNSY